MVRLLAAKLSGNRLVTPFYRKVFLSHYRLPLCRSTKRGMLFFGTGFADRISLCVCLSSRRNANFQSCKTPSMNCGMAAVFSMKRSERDTRWTRFRRRCVQDWSCCAPVCLRLTFSVNTAAILSIMPLRSYVAVFPVCQIPQSSWRNQLWQAEMVHGPGVAMRMRMERAMLKQFQRVPGLPSSFAGLDTVTGRDTTIDFDDILNSAYDVCSRRLECNMVALEIGAMRVVRY